MERMTRSKLARCAMVLCASVTVLAGNALAQGGTWTSAAPMLYARGGAAAGAIAGRLYVAGGTYTELPSEVYDPATDSWTPVAPEPNPRGPGGAVIDGRLYVVGGCLGSDCRIGVTNLLHVYDPITDTWTSKAPMPTPRWGAAVGAVNGKLYVAGGAGPCPPCTPILNTLEVYDPVTDTWATKAPMPTARTLMGEAAVIDGKLYVVGGTNWIKYLGTVEAYDPLTDTWSTKASMPTPRMMHGVGVVNGILYAVSGQDSNAVTHLPELTRVMEAYDPVSDTWAASTPIPTVHTSAAVGVLNGKMYVAGMCASGLCTTVDVFRPSGWPTPTLLSLFQGAWTSEGIEVRWQFGEPRSSATASLQRGDAADGPWTVVDGERRDEGSTAVLLDRGVGQGRTYWYRLVVTIGEGRTMTSEAIAVSAGPAPAGFGLLSVGPSPGSGTAQIEFALAGLMRVRLRVLDAQGRIVATLVDATHQAGRHQASWDGCGVGGRAPAGLYFVRFEAPGRSEVRRLVLVR